MPEFTTIPAQPWHCGQMCRLLRHGHVRAVMALGGGMDVHRELRGLFDQSSYRRAWLIDGELAALGGVAGSLISPYGFIWLTLTERATKYPKAIVREAWRQLDEIMRVKTELATTVLGEDEAAMRLAVFLGFHVAHRGEGAPAETRWGRLRLKRHLEREPEIRVPAGAGWAVAMVYHRPAENRPSTGAQEAA